MADRHKTHNGRDLGGHRKVPREDVDDVLTDTTGVDIIREDVRHGGAVADIGMDAGLKAREISNMIDENRDNVRKLAHKDGVDAPSRRRKT